MFSFLNTFARYEKEKAIYDADTETTRNRQTTIPAGRPFGYESESPAIQQRISV